MADFVELEDVDPASARVADKPSTKKSGQLTRWIHLCLPMIAAAVGYAIVFYTLGLVVIQQFLVAQSQSAAHANEIYVQGLLSPHVEALASNQTLTASNRLVIDEMLAQTSLGDHLIGLVIWDLKGEVAYSTIENRDENVLKTVEFQNALAGKLGIELVLEPEVPEVIDIPHPYFEVYVPLYGNADDTPVAVGEVYTDAKNLLAEHERAEKGVWFTVWIAWLMLFGLTFFVALLRWRGVRQLDVARNLLSVNKRLRVAAVRERIEATKSNENLLNLLGAEIHDGPIQKLSLLMLSLKRDGSQDTQDPSMQGHDLAQGIMEDLRAISGGLILPELQSLKLEDALLLAVSRQEKMVGWQIDADFSALPAQVDAGLAICLYRFVQEGLTNAYRHSGGKVSVVASRNGNQFSLLISDQGADGAVKKPEQTTHFGLGLQGIRNRFLVYGGKVSLQDNEMGGKDLLLSITLPSHQAQLPEE